MTMNKVAYSLYVQGVQTMRTGWGYIYVVYIPLYAGIQNAVQVLIFKEKRNGINSRKSWITPLDLRDFDEAVKWLN